MINLLIQIIIIRDSISIEILNNEKIMGKIKF